jgi:hypothetical protein
MAESHRPEVPVIRLKGEAALRGPPRAGSELEHLIGRPRILAPSAAGRKMARCLTWVSHQRLTGWACSQCGWTFPVPSLLTDQEAKSAYDRLASNKFQEHDCATHGAPTLLGGPDSFAVRARKLVTRGFKPKDAAQITLQEIIFENRNDQEAAKKAQGDAEDFLRHVKDGLI